MATHASALKAHRQSLVHRERNRKFRSQLRTTLKQIRLVIDAKDNAGAKKQLNAAISVIDKMAAKASSTATPPAATSHGSARESANTRESIVDSRESHLTTDCRLPTT